MGYRILVSQSIRKKSLKWILLNILLCFFSLSGAIQGSDEGIILFDSNDNDISTGEIQLVDWDGHIANPAVKVSIGLTTLNFPITLEITSPHDKVYFSLPSEVSSLGPSKLIYIQNNNLTPFFYISIFPDRDGDDEFTSLTIKATDRDGKTHISTTNIFVDDQDINRTSIFNVVSNFSQDQTYFFTDSLKRDVAQLAANDWAYFINASYDIVRAGEESTFVFSKTGWPDGFWVSNGDSYKGFLLYLHGHETIGDRQSTGGAPTGDGLQHYGGTETPLKRSGHVGIETKGNYNSLGWLVSIDDGDWWKSSNGYEPNDLYSITRHEIGHALAFNKAYDLYRDKLNIANSVFSDIELHAYLGHEAAIDNNITDHLKEIDPASQRGAFGYEYSGNTPRRRSLITKLDVLVLKAIGYSIYEPFKLRIVDDLACSGITQEAFNCKLRSLGGVPSFLWSIKGGTLPKGLKLDSARGIIYGEPEVSGSFPITVSVVDASAQHDEANKELVLNIQDNPNPIVWRTLTVSINGEGLVKINPTGISCNPHCISTVKNSTTISLVPAALDGYSFSGWGGACSGTSQCSLTMNGDKQVIATFSKIPVTFSVNASVNGPGRITSTPQGIDCGTACNSSFAENSNLVLSATPNTGYIFSGWSGACSGTSQCSLTMNGDKQVTANFIQIPPNPYDPTKPFVKPNIPSTTAFVKQPFTIGWQLNMIRKNMPVRVKFAKDGGVFRVIKSTKANAAGVGAYRWKPTKAHRTANGQLQICAVPSRGMAEVCSPTTNITAQ